MRLFGLLYPEQENVLHHWHQVKSISYTDESIVLENILFSIITALSKNEKSIIVIPDQVLTDKLIRSLNDFHLSGLCYYYNPNQSVTKNDVEQLQQLLNQPASIENQNPDYD